MPLSAPGVPPSSKVTRCLNPPYKINLVIRNSTVVGCSSLLMPHLDAVAKMEDVSETQLAEGQNLWV